MHARREDTSALSRASQLSIAWYIVGTPWKIVIPSSQSQPNPRTHDGFEWLYVLAGRMRLILGDQDLVLGVGEAVEFDTQVPH